MQPPPPLQLWSEALGLLLEHSWASDQALSVSSLTSSRESFGVAFLALGLVNRGFVRISLKSLDLSKCRLSAGKFSLLLDSLPDSVEEMELGISAIEGGTLPHLCRFLERAGRKRERGTPQLKRLSFTYCSRRSEGADLTPPLGRLKSLGESLGRLEGLQVLNVCMCRLGDESAKALFPTLPVALERLDLHSNVHIGPAGWESVREGLQRLQQLKSLRLHYCQLDDTTAKLLFPSLPLGLQSLELGWNTRLSSVGWEALGKRLESLRGLRELGVCNCALTDETVEALSLSLPDGAIMLCHKSHGADRCCACVRRCVP